MCLGCPTYIDRNVLNHSNFKKHILLTLPHVKDKESTPPGHTVILETNIQRSLSALRRTKVDRVLQHNIITTFGDANVFYRTKCIDPALYLYIRSYLICVNVTAHLEDQIV